VLEVKPWMPAGPARCDPEAGLSIDVYRGRLAAGDADQLWAANRSAAPASNRPADRP
jgi:hypothetical protein